MSYAVLFIGGGGALVQALGRLQILGNAPGFVQAVQVLGIEMQGPANYSGCGNGLFLGIEFPGRMGLDTDDLKPRHRVAEGRIGLEVQEGYDAGDASSEAKGLARLGGVGALVSCHDADERKKPQDHKDRGAGDGEGIRGRGGALSDADCAAGTGPTGVDQRRGAGVVAWGLSDAL